MKTSEVLAAGRERLERKGWIQGRWFSNEGYCMAGAISASDILTRRAAASGLLVKIDEMWPEGNYRFGHADATKFKLARFNDDPSRTKEEVLAVFDKAILSAQEHGD